MTINTEFDLDGRVAVIGMSGRFPGAANLDAFWENLRNGVESIRTLTEAELLAAGETLDNIREPSYVPAAAPLEDIDMFDAALFAMSPRDAAVFDPQHRIFLECAYEVFEHAGYVGDRINGAVGVFASCGASDYMFKNVLGNEQIATTVGEWLIRHTGNDTNFLATRVSYEFDLSGPSMNVQTACSSTLVAVHLACQSILSGESDLAIAGGAVVSPVQTRGYFFKEGEILSPDGHCRAFDERSAGTVISSAAGCVLLKSLAAAIADGDNVLAVIRGSAVNNDGRDKVGYLAPSVGGQARVVAEALAVADVDARDVSYVECHGTGTLIGDPIEIAGLTEAYRQATDDVQFCAIGSLKSNIGHAGEAAGIAALIKTILSLQHREIPPSLHFESPNPQADFPNSPFYVNAALQPWRSDDGGLRLAGVTGLGAGGTNAHVIVEEAPATVPATETAIAPRLVTISARSTTAADQAAAELAEHLRANPDLDLAHVAFTRLAGRKSFRSRRAVVASTPAEAAELLSAVDAKTTISQHHKGPEPSVIFMFPGGGAQYAGMGRDLYVQQPVYRSALDACCDFINPQLGLDLRSLLFVDGDLADASARLERPSVALPALFATEFATAQLMKSWGVSPSAMIGHSAGEYVAACLAGVITMEEGLALVALRGRLFETLPSGSMLSVSLSETDARARMPAGLSIAAINSPDLCVVSGPTDLVNQMESELVADEVDCVRVHIDVAAHSSMLEPILQEFGAFCRTITFAAPSIPYVSNLTGTWATAADVTDPDYWVRHLREAVRFSAGIETILADPNRILVEIGPGRTLASFARRATATAVAIAPTLRHPNETSSDVTFAMNALARIWAAGVDIDVDALFHEHERRRVPLPTYPFERRRYWVDPDQDATRAGARPPARAALRKRTDIGEWFSTPAWRRSITPSGGSGSSRGASTTLLIHDGAPIAARLGHSLVTAGERLVEVGFGDRFASLGGGRYTVNPSRGGDWIELIAALQTVGAMPNQIVHMTAIGQARGRRRGRLGRPDPLAAFEATVETDHASMLFLARALSGLSQPIRFTLITSGVHAVSGEPEIRPERALLHGACRVIPRELGNVDSVAMDIDIPRRASTAEDVLVERLTAELTASRDLAGDDTGSDGGPDRSDDVVVYRDGQRWVRCFDRIELPTTQASPWRGDGVYLITGGLGGIGLSLAHHIATTARGAALVLVGRTPMPPEEEWTSLLASPSTDRNLRHRITSVREMRAAGARVMLAPADVTDTAAMASVVDHVRAEYGTVTGVVHSAGILRDALIALRTPTAVSPVVDVKAKGILILDQLLARNPPELVVLCSSVSSIIGLPGQIDYTAANAFLDSFAAMKNHARSNAGGHTRAVVINWNAWQDVGMAVDAVEVAAGRTEANNDTPTTDPTQLFDQVVDDGDTQLATTLYSRSRQWLLAEHVVRGGEALIPGTGFVEIIRSAIAADTTDRSVPIELRDVFFLAPFAVADGEVRTMHVKRDRSTAAITIFSEAEAMPHVSAVGQLLPAATLSSIDLDEVRRRCTRRVERFDGYSLQPFMNFGPRWGNLRQVDYGVDEALITTVLPPQFAGELETLWLHPAVLDMAIGSAQSLIPDFDQAATFYAPFSYERVTAVGPIPATAVSHVRHRATAAQDLAMFDITICDVTGRAWVDIEGFTMRRVAPGAALTSRRAEQRPIEIMPNESPVESALREGITPAEGVEALNRVLAVDIGPQVVVSSVDLEHWIAKVDQEALGVGDDSEDAAGLSTQFERPEIESTYVAPATLIERELAAIWSELLGIQRVGRDDDFFDLGGQSLIAVRLFTRMRKRYSIDLALSTLFEAPTISQCAAIVAHKLGIVDDPIDDTDTTATVDGRTADGSDDPLPIRAVPPVASAATEPDVFRSLVTIQRGSRRVPFFCVHGAGGNVLNFRDLSLAMGRTQPFYGLQARGIDGILRPHGSIEEMAAAYLEEVRGVQPHGPYMFGGYSGGGLVAFEMARQATAADESVELVVLLDTFPPVIPRRPVTLRSSWDRLRADRMRYVHHIIDRRLAVRRRAAERARLDALLAAGEVVPTELREMHLEDNFAEVAARYVRQPWQGRVVLMRADDVAFAFQQLGESYGWDKFVIGHALEVVHIPGNHDTLVLEPNASRLVDMIRDTLDGPHHVLLGVAGG